MNRKLLICPWFGALPSWWHEYLKQLPVLKSMGYDMLIERNLDVFRNRVLDTLGLFAPVERGGSKVHDYRACLGMLYREELEGYEWWGHTDFDCVYGRLNMFADARKLANVDVYSQCLYDYLAGPFTLYRNTPATARMFLDVDGWRDTLLDPKTTGWVETVFTETAKKTVRVLIEDHHSCVNPQLLRREGERLLHDGKEISYFHFNRSKRWPL